MPRWCDRSSRPTASTSWSAPRTTPACSPASAPASCPSISGSTKRSARDATALLHDLRERDEGATAGAADDDDEYDGDESGESWREAPIATVNQRVDQRRRTAVALILGCCITFGTAHMFTGAWLRGVALAAVELVGIFQVGAGHTLGGAAAVAAVVVDICGAICRIRATRRTTLPVARLRSS